mmetsp:Transcript_17031/g.29291  ORF Transcript_17031/g.29291 Transcript_17031/m.29291 type:complete len:741 (+) Transcript_17031:926-3148(+)
MNDSVTTELRTVEGLLYSGVLAPGTNGATGAMDLSLFWDETPRDSFTLARVYGTVPPPFFDASGAVLNLFGDTILYFFGGGFEGVVGSSADLWSFNVGSMSFQKHSPQTVLLGSGNNQTSGERGVYPSKRIGCSLTSLGNRLFLFGGVDEGTYLDDAWVYSPPTAFVFPYETWTQLPTPLLSPSPRSNPASVAVNQTVYMYGGWDNEGVIQSDLWKAVVGTTNVTWERLCSQCQPLGRRRATMTYSGGFLYLHGGLTGEGELLSDLWSYGVFTGSWTKLEDGPVRRAGHTTSVGALATGPDNLIHIGGELEAGSRSIDRKSIIAYPVKSPKWNWITAFTPDESKCYTMAEIQSRTWNGDEANLGQASVFKERHSHISFLISSGNSRVDKAVILGGITPATKEVVLDLGFFHFSQVRVEENRNHLNPTFVTACWVLFAVNMTLAILSLLWIGLYWNNIIVLASQRPFLILISFGAMVSTSTIGFLLVDDQAGNPFAGPDGGNASADFACNVSVWMYSMGFMITFAPLYAKLDRVYKLFDTQFNLSMHFGSEAKQKTFKTKVTTSHLAKKIIALVSVDCIICMVWSFTDPLKFTRSPIITDESGNVLSSRGTCNSEHTYTFLSLLGSYHLMFLVYLSWICYKTSQINTAFSEAKYLRLAIFSSLQFFMFSVPVMVASHNSPEAVTLLKIGAVFMNDFSVLLCVFAPKVMMVKTGETAKVGAGTEQLESMRSKRLMSSTNSRI